MNQVTYKIFCLLADVLRWLAKKASNLAILLYRKANSILDEIIEYLQIKTEEMPRKGQDVTYRLMASHDCGLEYVCVQESKSIKELLIKGKQFDRQMLRWYIEDSVGVQLGIYCKVHSSILRQFKKKE